MGYLTVTKPSSEMPETSAANHSSHRSTAKSPLMHHVIAPFPFGQLPPCLLKLGLAQCSQPHRGPLSLSTGFEMDSSSAFCTVGSSPWQLEAPKSAFSIVIFSAFPPFLIFFFILISAPIYSLFHLVRHRIHVYITSATVSLPSRHLLSLISHNHREKDIWRESRTPKS